MGLLVTGASSATFYTVYAIGIKAYLFFDDANYMKYLVYRPWFRLPSFIMGMILGIIISRIHASRTRITMSFIRHLIFVLFGVIICIFSIIFLEFNITNLEFNMSAGFN